jgi:hypothetical protein
MPNGLSAGLRDIVCFNDGGESGEAAESLVLGGALYAGHGTEGEVVPFADLLRRRSISSSTILISKSVGSSKFTRFSVKLLTFSAILSHPQNCRKSRSVISSVVTFLKTNNGTAESKGNSS